MNKDLRAVIQDLPPSGASNRRDSASAFLALVIYFALSALFFARAAHWAGQLFVGGGDPQQTVWFLHWWPFAISHDLNPFVTKYVWSPHGFNMTWATSVPLAALVSAPLTILGGPVLSYNLLTLSAPALSAWTAFLLSRYLTRDWWASLFGGYLFGFSSYELGQLLGHLNLDMTCLVPVAILLCVRRARGDLSRGAFILGLALVLLGEMGLSTEVLATLCVLGAIAWMIFFLCAPARDRSSLGSLAAEGAAAGVLMAVLAAPFLFYLVKGLPDVPGEINSVSFFSADPLNYIFPTIVTRFGRTLFAELAGHFSGNGSEQGAYLGVPLIAIMAIYFSRNIRAPYVRALLITTCMLVVLSLGPWLHVAGFKTTFPLPWILTRPIPLLHSVLPTRFTMYVALCASVAAALWLREPRGRRNRCGRFALAGVACLFLVPNLSLYAWTPWPQQPFFVQQRVRQALGSNSRVIILPFGSSGPGMAWQLDAGMTFTQSGGYTGFTPRGELAWPVLNELSGNGLSPNFRNDLAAFSSTHRVNYILMGPGTPPNVASAVSALGWPSLVDHGVTVVKASTLGAASYSYIQGDYWPSVAADNWMGHQIRITTHNCPEILTLSGKWRPAQTGSTVVAVDSPFGNVRYRIDQSSRQKITLPSNSVVTVTASRTFIPNRFIHNGDRRKLSVLISLKALKSQ